jgi:hypothetical protein
VPWPHLAAPCSCALLLEMFTAVANSCSESTLAAAGVCQQALPPAAIRAASLSRRRRPAVGAVALRCAGRASLARLLLLLRHHLLPLAVGGEQRPRLLVRLLTCTRPQQTMPGVKQGAGPRQRRGRRSGATCPRQARNATSGRRCSSPAAGLQRPCGRLAAALRQACSGPAAAGLGRS